MCVTNNVCVTVRSSSAYTVVMQVSAKAPQHSEEETASPEKEVTKDFASSPENDASSKQVAQVKIVA